MSFSAQYRAVSDLKRGQWAGPALLALILLSVSSGLAQSSRVGATLEGTVTDSSGAVIKGAAVHLHDVATGLRRKVTTDPQGLFRAGDLPVGTYEVRVELPGFAPYVHTGVTLTLGQTARLDIHISPAMAVEKVTVTEQPSIISPSETTVTTTVDKERIEELPVQTRNALDFVLLAPGVASSSGAASTTAQTPLAGSGFSFGGLRPRSNDLSIDGLDNNDEFSGGSRTELSPEIVREFQVVNNGLSAEYGGASGGSINVVTRDGANTPHGDAFVFLQSGALNARGPLMAEPGRPPLTRYRAGVARGGAIIKNRTFYYVAAEQEHIRTQSDSDIDPALVSQLNNFLSSSAYPRLATRQLTSGFFPVARSETEASAKINHQLSDRHSLMLRYAFTNNKEAGEAFNTSGLVDASARGSNFTEDNSLAGSLTSLFGGNAVNGLRFQIARRSVALRTGDQTGPGVDIVGLASFGRPYAGNSRHREDHHELTDTYARSHGHHLFKAGATVNDVHLSSLEPDGFGGTYIFATPADFFAGTPHSFRQAFGRAHSAFSVTSYGSFFQDRWSVAKQVTLDLGLRYDFEHLPSNFNQDTNNFSPRIGLAYSPSSRWVMRGGYGIFFDRAILSDLLRAAQGKGLRSYEQIAGAPAAAALFDEAQGGALLQPDATIRPSIFQADPHLATPYSAQANFGVQYLLAKNLTASANYLFVRGVKLSRTRNTNLLPPSILTAQNAASLGVPNPTPQQLGREVFGPGRLNPAFDAVNLLEDSAGSTYNGVSFSLNRQLEDLTLSASYTFSKTTDDGSDFAEQPQNPFNLREERALSLDDQRHRFVLSGLFDLPFGDQEEGVTARRGKRSNLAARWFSNIELAPIITVGSGRPENPLTGLDSNFSHAFPLASRPLGLGRNALRTRPTASVDFRVLKAIYFSPQRHLDLVVESFNALNHLNVTGLNPYLGSSLRPLPFFAQPIEALPARQIEFSIDWEY